MAERPDTHRENRVWALRVRERDGWRCRMERRRCVIVNNQKTDVWEECATKGGMLNPIDPSHIYPRRECAGAKFDLAVGIASCRRCHDKYGAYDPSVRVPPAREAAAWRAISAPGASKVLPPRRRPDGRRV